jgi:hypothetical protein
MDAEEKAKQEVCLPYFSTLKPEAIYFSETSVN